ncbi:MAG: DUF2057 domain-containing protein [Neptuniibacter sp.]
MAKLNNILSNTLVLVAALISFNSYAEVKLEVGEGVNLLAVNGEEVESDSLFASKTSARLPNGTNQILVNYTAEIKPGDDSELEVTKPSVILFKTDASELYLSAPKMKTVRDVENFEKSLNWNLRDQNGNPISFKAALLIKEGFQLSRDYEDELEEFNMSNANAALPKTRIISPAEVKHARNAQHSQVTENKNMAMDMLIYWYNQADEKTRRSFKELISK